MNDIENKLMDLERESDDLPCPEELMPDDDGYSIAHFIAWAFSIVCFGVISIILYLITRSWMIGIGGAVVFYFLLYCFLKKIVE